MFRVCHAFLSVLCSLLVTYWDRAGLLALVCDVFFFFVIFLCRVKGQVWNFVTRKTPLSLLNYLNNIVYSHVGEFVTLFVICLIIYLIGLLLNSKDILLVFPWVLIVSHLLQICVLFCYEKDYVVSF